jgi:hypothetical protein
LRDSCQDGARVLRSFRKPATAEASRSHEFVTRRFLPKTCLKMCARDPPREASCPLATHALEAMATLQAHLSRRSRRDLASCSWCPFSPVAEIRGCDVNSHSIQMNVNSFPQVLLCCCANFSRVTDSPCHTSPHAVHPQLHSTRMDIVILSQPSKSPRHESIAHERTNERKVEEKQVQRLLAILAMKRGSSGKSHETTSITRVA